VFSQLFTPSYLCALISALFWSLHVISPLCLNRSRHLKTVFGILSNKENIVKLLGQAVITWIVMVFTN
jgi:hypothetical protein